MRKLITLVFLLLTVFISPVYAKKPAKPQPVPLTVEQEQQFTYYWYAAKQAIEQHRYPEALVLLEFCRLINPNDGQTLTFLAVMYNGLGQTERALATYRQAFEADPRDQWYKYSHMLLEMHTADAAQRERNVLEAVHVLEQARKAQLPNVEEDLLEHLLRLYMSLGYWDKTVTTQDELDKIKGFDAYSALNRFRAYASWGKDKKAIQAVDRYLELDPTNVQFLMFKLEIMERSKAKTADLYAIYERILELDPMNISVLNNYAYHLATHKGDLQKAERMSAVTIREAPSNAVYLDTYGWILHMQGQDELARFYLQRALGNTENPNTKAEIEKHLKQLKK